MKLTITHVISNNNQQNVRTFNVECLRDARAIVRCMNQKSNEEKGYYEGELETPKGNRFVGYDDVRYFEDLFNSHCAKFGI